MPVDRKIWQVWAVVFLAIFTWVFIYLIIVPLRDGRTIIIHDVFMTAVFAFVSVSWTALSQEEKRRFLLGYGAPFLVTVSGVISAYVCQGVSCSVWDLDLFMLSAVAISFYTLGLAMWRWGTEVSALLLLVETLFLTGYIFFYVLI